MCWFITAAIPGQSAAAIRNAARDCPARVSLWPLGDTPTTALFAPGSACVAVIRGNCSCDLADFDRSSARLDVERERARLARRGWSAARIERVIAEKMESAARQRGHSRADTVTGFRQLVALAVREAGAVQLFAHFHQGDPGIEAVDAKAATAMPLATFERDGFPPDTLVTVRA